MGGGDWSSRTYLTSSVSRKSKGLKDFGYDHDIKTGKAKGIHADLDPANLKDGLRESRDSEEHPESLPVMIFFDVTGSMGEIPKVLQKKLAELMDVILGKAEVEHPQILVGAVGDTHCDRYPLQIGQFESDNRFDDQLRNIILEGGGGNQRKESYGVVYHFAARNTVTDAFEKRGKKGYLFTIGDEGFWPVLSANELAKMYDLPFKEEENVHAIYTEASEKWEIYHLNALDGSYSDDMNIQEQWREMMGERFVNIEDSSLICETIASLIYAMESSKSIDEVVIDMGLTGKDGEIVTKAISTAVNSGLPSEVAEGDLPQGTVIDSDIERI